MRILVTGGAQGERNTGELRAGLGAPGHLHRQVALLAGHFLVSARQKELGGGVIESRHVFPTRVGVTALAIGG